MLLALAADFACAGGTAATAALEAESGPGESPRAELAPFGPDAARPSPASVPALPSGQAPPGDGRPRLLAAPAPQAADQDDDAAGQLSLVGEEDDIDPGGDELDRRVAELENELARTLEEADRVRVEQRELRSRLDDLDEQIVMARQIIALQEQELARTRTLLAAEAEQQARQAAERAAVAAAETPPPRRFPESLPENPLWLAAGAAILLLAFAALLLSRAGRRREDDDGREQAVAVGDGEDAAESAPAAAGPAEERGEPAGESSPAATAESAADAATDDEDDDDDFIAELEGAEEEEVAEQLHLAYSFYKMKEMDKARRILENVIRFGNEGQIREAGELLAIVDDSG